jgi:two-component system chemotaxis response regulator CheY
MTMAKILVVDDSLFMRKSLSDILEKEGHEVVGEAQNAKEAVSLYKKLKPDLMTLDIVMPEVEGLDAMKALRTITSYDRGARVLMVSAMGQQELVVESIRSGARDFVVKPFQPSQVAGAVRRLLSK